jgi:hypothetical protein
METLGVKVHNPIVLALGDHLKSEWEIYSQRDDLYYLGWLAIALANDDPWKKGKSGFIRASLEQRLKTLRVSSFEDVVSGKVVREIALGLCAVAVLGGRVTSAQRRKMAEILDFSQSKEWFESPQTAAIICFSLSGDKRFDQRVASATAWLQKRLSNALQAEQYEIVADCLFGLAHAADTIQNLPHTQLVARLANHTADRLAKAAWFCLRLDDEAASYASGELIKLLEDRIRKKFQGWATPELQLALFEGVNLINSNLPPEEVVSILERVRTTGVAWARRIEPKGDQIVVTNLPHVSKLPRFDAAEDALSYVVLRAAGRGKVYQLTDEEYETATRSIRMLGLDHKVSRRHLKRAHLIGWINIAAAFLLGILIVKYDLISDLVAIVVDLVQRQWQAAFAKALSTRRLAAIGILIMWVLLILQLRLNDQLANEGEVTEPVWHLLPIIPSIAKGWNRLRGRKEETKGNDDN